MNTFGILRRASFEQRSVAVVVDPLREQHGVYISEKKATNRDAGQADAKVELSEDLEARYHKFLNRMRALQNKMGKEEIPFILPGVLYQQRRAMGDVDDVMEAKLQALDKLHRQSVKDAETIRNLEQRIKTMEVSQISTKSSLEKLNTKLEKEVRSLQTKLGLQAKKVRTLEERNEIIRDKFLAQDKKLAGLEEKVRALLPRLVPVVVESTPATKEEEQPQSGQDSPSASNEGVKVEENTALKNDFESTLSPKKSQEVVNTGSRSD